MYIGRVKGTVTSTIKHKLFDGRKLMLVARLNLDGSETSTYDIALDDVQAGIGDVVVVLDEGSSARQVIGVRGTGPARAIIVGIVDEITTYDPARKSRKKPAQTEQVPARLRQKNATSQPRKAKSEKTAKDAGSITTTVKSSLPEGLQTEADVPVLLEALLDVDDDDREEAIKALGEIPENALRALLAALQDPDPDLRAVAAEVLGYMANPAAINPLLERLQDENPKVREAVAGALGDIREAIAVPGLLVALHDPHPDVREASAWALGNIGDPSAIPDLLITLEADAIHIRWSAIEALGKIGDPAAVKGLIAVLDHDLTYMSQAAAEALRNIDNSEARAALKAWKRKQSNRS